MHDDFSLPYMHQKPIFSPLSCSIQVPLRISGENIFFEIFTQVVGFALFWPIQNVLDLTCSSTLKLTKGIFFEILES